MCFTPINQFHQRFSDAHGFTKPNEERALQLMDKAAQALMEEYPDIVLAFGESNEFRYKVISHNLYTMIYLTLG